MAISEDLRSVQAMLGKVDMNNAVLVRLLRDNLSALADQVEALEGVPLAPATYDGFLHGGALLSMDRHFMEAPVQ